MIQQETYQNVVNLLKHYFFLVLRVWSWILCDQ
jgi:hypothetical protein